MRFALSVDEDLRPFYDQFRRDPLLGPAIRKRPWLRARRRPGTWEALAWAITGQLIEAVRACEIQRRMVWRYGPSGVGERPLRDVPCAAEVARRAPAELAACDLAPKRAIAMIRCAREVAAGRIDPADPDHDALLLRISEIGPWTVQVLGLEGRGDDDSLPAGDLAYVKLVGTPARPRPPRRDPRDRGVLRPLRALPRPRRILRDGPLPPRRPVGPAVADGGLAREKAVPPR